MNAKTDIYIYMYMRPQTTSYTSPSARIVTLCCIKGDLVMLRADRTDGLMVKVLMLPVVAHGSHERCPSISAAEHR